MLPPDHDPEFAVVVLPHGSRSVAERQPANRLPVLAVRALMPAQFCVFNAATGRRAAFHKPWHVRCIDRVPPIAVASANPCTRTSAPGTTCAKDLIMRFSPVTS